MSIWVKGSEVALRQGMKSPAETNIPKSEEAISIPSRELVPEFTVLFDPKATRKIFQELIRQVGILFEAPQQWTSRFHPGLQRRRRYRARRFRTRYTCYRPCRSIGPK